MLGFQKKYLFSSKDWFWNKKKYVLNFYWKVIFVIFTLRELAPIRRNTSYSMRILFNLNTRSMKIWVSSGPFYSLVHYSLISSLILSEDMNECLDLSCRFFQDMSEQYLCNKKIWVSTNYGITRYEWAKIIQNPNS